MSIISLDNNMSEETNNPKGRKKKHSSVSINLTTSSCSFTDDFK